MVLYPLELEANLVQLFVFIVLTAWFGIRHKKEMTLSNQLFLWGMIGHIMMNVYWNTMLVLDGNGTYDFTACDASAIGSFVVWASMFQLKWKGKLSKRRDWNPVTFTAVLFGVWNIIWWIIWSGHFVVNTIEGIAIVFLLFQVVYALEKEKAFLKSYKPICLGWIAILVILQNFIYLDFGLWSRVSNGITMATWILFCLCIFVWAWRDKQSRSLWLFALRVLVLLAEFLSDGIFYSILMLMETFVIVVLVLTFDSKRFEEVTDQ